MADESGERVGPIETRELFRLGDPAERFESIFHSVALVAGAFVVAVALSSVGITMLSGVGITSEATPALYEALVTGVYFAGMLAVSLWYLDWQDEYDLIGLRWPTMRDVTIAIGGVIAVIAVISGLEILLQAAGIEIAENSAVEAGRNNPELYLYYIPVVLLLNSPGEELLFRGVVQGKLRQAFGVVPGVLGAAAIFGMVHYVALVGAGSQLAYVGIAFLSGLVLGALYEYSGNFVVPVAVHAAWNIIVYVNLYLGATGGL